MFDAILENECFFLPLYTCSNSHLQTEIYLTLNPCHDVTVPDATVRNFLLTSNKGEAQGHVGRSQPQPLGICIKSTSSDGLILRPELFWLSDRRR
jgi:hypothetical protein